MGQSWVSRAPPVTLQQSRGLQPSRKIKISYCGYRFPSEIIQHAIWLYVQFTLSFRDVDGLLAGRGILVSYEIMRRWVNHFGPIIAAHLRKRRPKPDTTWHLDEIYLKIDWPLGLSMACR
jgi:transposase-like protein